MPSSVTWLDFSEADRRKMIEVTRLFRQPDIRDEMGLAPIRDTLADILFPGTGTLQTRARYFLFIPWTYTYYENRQLSTSIVEERIRRDEIRLIRALKQARESGVIGQVSGASLLRFPSSIYWYGLRQWGVLRYPGSQAQYHQSLNSYYRRRKAHKAQEVADDELDGAWAPNWDLGLPKGPEGFPWEISPEFANFTLTYEESSYLRNRLQISCADSLLTYLVLSTQPAENVSFVWFHPEVANFPTRLRKIVRHAQNFSEAIWGTALLYNLMLSQKAGLAERENYYEAQIVDWRNLLLERESAIRQWARHEFWAVLAEHKIPRRTQAFVNEWLDLLLGSSSVLKPSSHSGAQQLIRNREVQLKGNRSRFENRRRLEVWGGASSAGQLDFRWQNANRIIYDILAGLHTLPVREEAN